MFNMIKYLFLCILEVESLCSDNGIKKRFQVQYERPTLRHVIKNRLNDRLCENKMVGYQ